MAEEEDEIAAIMREFGITDEARAYNAETMAAAAREAMPEPIKGGSREPFFEHIRGYTHTSQGTRFYPIGADGGGGPLTSISSGDVYALSRAAQMITDILKLSAQNVLIYKLHASLPGIINYPMNICTAAKTLTGHELAKRVFNDSGQIEKFLIDAWWIGLANGMGSSYAQAIEQYYNPGQLRYAYNTLQWQTSLLPRMRRYWMSQYTPSVPSPNMAWDLLLRGIIKDSEFKEFASFEGWDAKSADLLKEAWKSVPNERAAFRMNRRGALSDVEFDKYVWMNGWPKGWEKKLYAMYQWLPNARDAFRLSRREAIKKDQKDFLYRAQGYDAFWYPYLDKLWERIPLPLDAFKMLMRGVIGYKDWATYLSKNEWEVGADKYLYEIYQKLPSSHEAFYMQRKGLITIATRDFLYKANGYDPKYHSFLTQNYEYVPTLYDLTRIADYVEIDLIWATKVLKERGLKDRDIPKIIAMLKIRPLRTEITRQISLWLNRRMYGWVSETDFEAAIQTYVDKGFVQTTEKTLLLEEGQLKYEDELMREQIEILEWQFRTAVITQDQLEQSLLDLGIVQEKVNLMVELLLAQGYYGYY